MQSVGIHSKSPWRQGRISTLYHLTDWNGFAEVWGLPEDQDVNIYLISDASFVEPGSPSEVKPIELDQEIVNEVHAGKTIICFDRIVECHDFRAYHEHNAMFSTANFLDLLHPMIVATNEKYNFTRNQVFIATGNALAEHTDDYHVLYFNANEQFWGNSDRVGLTLEYYQSQRELITSRSDRSNKIYAPLGSPKPYRIMLAKALESLGFRHHSLITLNSPYTDKGQGKWNLKVLENLQLDQDPIIDTLPWTAPYDELPLHDINDGEHYRQNYALRAGMQDSFVLLVGESRISPLVPNAKEIVCTEKTFRPFHVMAPFVILGHPGTIAHVQSLGFKTFSNWWDESYDLIDDNLERQKAVIEVVDTIANKSDNELKDMLVEMLPTLEHNYTVTKQRLANRSKELAPLVHSMLSKQN